MTQPPQALEPKQVPLDAEGRPINPQDAVEAMYEMIARLVIGWRVYDATADAIDPDTGEALDQPLLGLPATPDEIRKLPMKIIAAIAEKVKAGANPL